MANPFDMQLRGSVQQWSEELAVKVGEAIEGNMLKAAELARGSVVRAAFEAFPGSRGGLGRSYTATLLAPKEGKLRSGALSDLVYARIQDEGGTITPKNAKALAIPFSTEAKSLSARGVGPREFPRDLSLIWPAGKDVGRLVDKAGDVQYWLKNSVTLPGTNYLDKAADIADPLIEELFDGEIQVEAGEAKAGGE